MTTQESHLVDEAIQQGATVIPETTFTWHYPEPLRYDSITFPVGTDLGWAHKEFYDAGVAAFRARESLTAWIRERIREQTPAESEQPLPEFRQPQQRPQTNQNRQQPQERGQQPQRQQGGGQGNSRAERYEAIDDWKCDECGGACGTQFIESTGSTAVKCLSKCMDPGPRGGYVHTVGWLDTEAGNPGPDDLPF